MNSLYWLVTITDRRSTDAFLALYAEFGVTVSLRTVGSGTAQKNAIRKAIMRKADPKAGAIVFSLPVTDTAGLRLLDEES